jgi:hypothetical protein
MPMREKFYSSLYTPFCIITCLLYVSLRIILPLSLPLLFFSVTPLPFHSSFIILPPHSSLYHSIPYYPSLHYPPQSLIHPFFRLYPYLYQPYLCKASDQLSLTLLSFIYPSLLIIPLLY